MDSKLLYQELNQRIRELERETRKRIDAENTLKKKSHDLGERVKELKCLYGISRLVDNPDTSFEEILQGITDLIPPSWQYPEITCAEITIHDQTFQTFQTENFRDTPWKQTGNIYVHGKQIGTMKVGYLQKKPQIDEGPFLKEERDLINAICQRLGKIIEHKRADDELRKNEEKYRAIFENTGSGTIIVEEDMVISMVNQKWRQLTGYTLEETIGTLGWADFITEEDIEKMIEYHRKRINGVKNVPAEYECTMIDKSGNRKNTLVMARLIPGTRKTVASFADMTSYKNALEALHESQNKLSEILDASEGFIFTIDRDYRIEFMNRALIDRIGCNAVGKRCFELELDIGFPCSKCPQADVFNGDTVTIEHNKSGDGKWYHSIHSPIFDTNGVVVKKQVMVLDITKRKLSEEALRQRENDLRRENIRLKKSIAERYRFGDIIGKSQPMQEVYKLILQAAASDANVIIYGESGTGKELVAHAIHANSDRSGKQMVCVNCGAIPENLLEAEFFGYRKGAFTGATLNKYGYLDIASAGTLFMDELGELPMNMQVKLLRAIEGGGFTPIGSNTMIKADIRIIAATNRNIFDLVRKNQFRKDFFYRIHVIPITLPPLRHRKEDIPLLIEHFLKEYSSEKAVPVIPARSLEAMQRYDWPGNVRELQNTLYRYVTLGRLDFMRNDIEESFENPSDAMPQDINDVTITGLHQHMKGLEKEIIIQTLEQNDWHRTRVASILKINRKTLFKKMKAYGIS